MKYQWILFDLDNTILDFDRSETFAFKKSFEDFQIPYNASYLEIYHEINRKCWEALEKGLINQVQLRIIRMANFFKAINIQIDDRAFGKQYLKNLSETQFFIEGAKNLLDHLHTKYALAIITNGLQEVQRHHIAVNDLTSYFKTIIVSDEIGVSKPQKAFFDYTFKQIGQPDKASVLVIGDSLSSDIKGGINYGLDTCWFNPKNKPNILKLTPTYQAKHTEDIKHILTN